MAELPHVQRVAAYAVILRDQHILLSRLSARLTSEELWTLPGGGVEHGEDPRAAAVREIHEETGLDAEVGETARVYSFHQAHAWRGGRRVDAHSLRIVYEGWVPPDAPEPHVVEVDGSTADAAWVSLADVRSGAVPAVTLVHDALGDYLSEGLSGGLPGQLPVRRQRVAAYALVVRDDAVLLTRISARGHHRGAWTLPGGGVDHGESPRAALVREVREECGVDCEVGEPLAIDDTHFTGTAPSGREEDFHGIHLVYAGSVAPGAEPRVAEVDGTTDAAAWVRIADVEDKRVEVLDVVRAALAARGRRTTGA